MDSILWVERLPGHSLDANRTRWAGSRPSLVSPELKGQAMSALVVVESMWGNTRAVAEAVARGLGEEVEVVEVQDAPTPLPDNVDLLVVGGPTHAFAMSRSTTRHDAVERGARGADEAHGIREWLD